MCFIITIKILSLTWGNSGNNNNVGQAWEVNEIQLYDLLEGSSWNLSYLYENMYCKKPDI